MQQVKKQSSEESKAIDIDSHYFSNPMEFNPKQASKADFDTYITKAHAFTDQILMKITNTQTKEQASQTLKKHSRPGGSCSSKIKENEVSWRCATCAINQNTIICNQCIKHGKHEGHQLSSIAGMGGRCDCGDKGSLVKQGYCSHHSGQVIDEFDLSQLDQNIRNKAQEEIERSIKALDYLCLQIEKIPELIEQILKHVIFLTTIGSLNTYAVKMIVVSMCKKSRSKYYKHFHNIFDQKKCNTWVSSQLIKFDKWFQFIEQGDEELKGGDGDGDDDGSQCQCLRFDNLLRSMIRMTNKQKDYLNDLYFVMCKSYKFRVMGSIIFSSNFHFLGCCSVEDMLVNENASRFDVFLNLGYQLFPQAEAVDLILQSDITQTCITQGFKKAIQAYKDKSNIFGQFFVEKVLSYFHQIAQCFFSKHGNQVFDFYSKMLPYLCQLDFFISNPKVPEKGNLQAAIKYFDFQNMMVMQISLLSMKLSEKLKQMNLENQLKIFKILQKGFDNLVALKESVKEKEYSYLQPTTVIIASLMQQKILPFLFARLKHKKIIIEPIMKQTLDTQFANSIIQKYFVKKDNEHLVMPSKVPQGGNLSSLSNSDCLFHYVCNTFRYILGLTVDNFKDKVKSLLLLTSDNFSFPLDIKLSFQYFHMMYSQNIYQALMQQHQQLINFFALNNSLYQFGMMLGQAPIFGEFYLEFFKTTMHSKTLTKQIYPELLQPQTYQLEVSEVVGKNLKIMLPILGLHSHIFLFQPLFAMMKQGKFKKKSIEQMTKFFTEYLFKLQLIAFFGKIQKLGQGDVGVDMNLLALSFGCQFEKLPQYKNLLHKYVDTVDSPDGMKKIVLKKEFRNQIPVIFQPYVGSNEFGILETFQIIEMDKKKENIVDILGIISTKRKYGIRSLPIIDQLRNVASAFNYQFIEKAMDQQHYKNRYNVVVVYSLLKLILVGVEARYLDHQVISKQQYEKFQAKFDQLKAQIKGPHLEVLFKRVLNFMEDRKNEDEVKIKSSQEQKGAKGEENQFFNNYLNQMQNNTPNDVCMVCLKKFTDTKNMAYGHPCIISSNNFIGQAQLQYLDKSQSGLIKEDGKSQQQEEEGKNGFKRSEWKDSLHEGHFSIKPCKDCVHYNCLKNGFQLDHREFMCICRSNCNTVIPCDHEEEKKSQEEEEANDQYKPPNIQQYLKINSRLMLYKNPYPQIVLLTSVYEFMTSMAKDQISNKLKKEYCYPQNLKNNLEAMPRLILRLITDNAILACKMRGLSQYLRQNRQTKSIARTLIGSLRKAYKLFQKDYELDLDSFQAEVNQDYMKSQAKPCFEVLFTRLLFKNETMSESVIQRIRKIMNLYGQYLIEIKKFESQELNLDKRDFLGIVEFASALVLTFFKYDFLMSENGEEMIKKIEQLSIQKPDESEQTIKSRENQLFNLLWESVLQQNPLIPGTLSNKLVGESTINPILGDITKYQKNLWIRAQYLAPSRKLKLNLIKLSSTFVGFQQQYFGLKCKQCNDIPKIPAVCLMCGQLVCFNDKCCSVGLYDEGFKHSFECCYGTGVFMYISNSDIRVTIVQTPTNNPVFSTPYRNEFGEMAGMKASDFNLDEKIIRKFEEKLMKQNSNIKLTY